MPTAIRPKPAPVAARRSEARQGGRGQGSEREQQAQASNQDRPQAPGVELVWQEQGVGGAAAELETKRGAGVQLTGPANHGDDLPLAGQTEIVRLDDKPAGLGGPRPQDGSSDIGAQELGLQLDRGRRIHRPAVVGGREGDGVGAGQAGLDREGQLKIPDRGLRANGVGVVRGRLPCGLETGKESGGKHDQRRNRDLGHDQPPEQGRGPWIAKRRREPRSGPPGG